MGLDALKAAPINILQAETGEPPLDFPRRALASRFLVSLYSCKTLQFGRIRRLAICHLVKTLWQKKHLPLHSFINNTCLLTSDVICREAGEILSRLQCCTNPPSVLLSKVTELPSSITAYLHSHWPKATYTDGSVLNKTVVCAVNDATKNFCKTFKLWDQAESIAILQISKYPPEEISACKEVIIIMNCCEMHSLSLQTSNQTVTLNLLKPK